MAATALLAGGTPEAAVRLAASMVLLQASVGAVNDVVDAPRDAGHKPGKPIPRGLVGTRAASAVAVLAAAGGVALAIPSGGATVALALGLLGLGYAYDLAFKGTAWSWLPFALAIPLFPTYGWLGAAGSLPGAWAVLLPVAVLAGAGLAIGNAAADLERDQAAGVESVARRLGASTAWTVQAALLGVVVAAAVATLVAAGDRTVSLALVLGAGGLVLAAVAWGRGGDPGRRERAWELEAVGVGLLAVGWLAGMVLGS